MPLSIGILTLRNTGTVGAEAGGGSDETGCCTLFIGAFGRGLYEDDVRNSGGVVGERPGRGEPGDVTRGDLT
jgi:hypothetical protein